MSSQDPAIGRQIQEYRITALLGEGGMGKVYLAQQERIGKKIAIKSLKASISSNHTALARFFREAESVNKIQHENVVDIFNLVHDPKENEFFILMEYIDGRTLGGAIREEAPFPARTIGHIGLQICSALAAAHPLGIIHRDLKSYNIILTTRAGQKNFVKILDFGLAGLLDPSSIDQPSLPHLTVKGVPMGSPAYMSPEHVLGAQIDARSDIYSFGVILYEMATGARPFVADNIKELSQNS